MTSLIKQRIENGDRWLSENWMSGWYNEIDLDSFCIHDSKDCVLGQLDLDFLELGDENGIDWLAEHGFDVDHSGMSADDLEIYWENLQEEWIKVIRFLQSRERSEL